MIQHAIKPIIEELEYDVYRAGVANNEDVPTKEIKHLMQANASIVLLRRICDRRIKELVYDMTHTTQQHQIGDTFYVADKGWSGKIIDITELLTPGDGRMLTVSGEGTKLALINE